MNEAIKLDRIKSSCKAGTIVSTIFTILAIIGCVMALIGGVSILSMGEKFDNAIIEAKDEGYVSTEIHVGTGRMFGIDITDPASLETDIPALEEALNGHPYSTMYGLFCIAISFICACLAVLLKLLGSVFSIIGKEGPFTEKVVKRVLIVMIVFSALMFIGSGLGAGLICGILTWVVYTIMDYGKTLQDQSNETL